MQILIAPNAFKNSLSAQVAADAIEIGLLRSKLDCVCQRFPIADGGDGTGELIVQQCGGTFIDSKVNDPLNRIINSRYGLIAGGANAVIEMADASGLRLLDAGELNPLNASTYGTGQLIKLALDSGVTEIVIAMGGSATVDGGAGILSALGLKFLDSKGELLLATPSGLIDLDRVDTSELDNRLLECKITILCDVDNSLLGENGAARVFGPQKGASPEQIQTLEAFLSKFAALAVIATGKDMLSAPYSGTAGGAAAGLYAFLNAQVVNGAEYFLDLTEFRKALQKADLVITGEGSLDEQTLHGKGPFAVARLAKDQNIPVIGLAGKIPLQENYVLNKYFDVLMSIGNEPSDLKSAMRATKANLTRTATAIGNLLALKA